MIVLPRPNKVATPCDRKSNTVLLLGFLSKISQKEELEKNLEASLEHLDFEKTITIDAQDLNVNAAGSMLWIEACKKYFSQATLRYRDSRLSEILKSDEEYLELHPKAFEE